MKCNFLNYTVGTIYLTTHKAGGFPEGYYISSLLLSYKLLWYKEPSEGSDLTFKEVQVRENLWCWKYSFCFPLAKGFKETCLKMFVGVTSCQNSNLTKHNLRSVHQLAHRLMVSVKPLASFAQEEVMISVNRILGLFRVSWSQFTCKWFTSVLRAKYIFTL